MTQANIRRRTPRKPRMLEPRCEQSDLLVSQCACLICRPDLVEHAAYAVHDLQPHFGVKPGDGAQLDEVHGRIVRKFVARLATRCDGCDARIYVGDIIARTSDGDDVCEECAA